MGNTFIAWCSPTSVTDSLDHTWVESISPKDKFMCFGGTDPTYRHSSHGADSKAHCKASFCRGPMDSNYIIYGVNGVCHQAANRFLYPVGETLYNDSNGRPRGYIASFVAYGPWGNTYLQWLPTIYAPANIKCALPWNLGDSSMAEGSVDFAVEQVYLKADQGADENDLLIAATEILLNHYIPNLGANPISTEQRVFYKEKERVLATVGLSTMMQDSEVPKLLGADVTSVFSRVNELGKEVQRELQMKIGRDSYASLTYNEDTLYDLVDLEIAKVYYSAGR